MNDINTQVNNSGSTGNPASQPQQQPIQQPAQQTMPQPPPRAPNPKSPGNKSLLFGAVVLIIIIAIVAAFFTLGSGLGNQNKLANELASPSNQTPAAIAIIVAKGVGSANQLNVSYSGEAVVSTKGSELGGLSLQIPFKFSYQKYGSNSRFYINASGIPILGNITETAVSLSNGTEYSCSGAGSVLSSLFGGSSSGAESAQGTHCERYTGQMSSSIDSYTNSLSELNNNTKVKVVGTEQYNGQSCSLVLMNGSLHQNGESVNYNASMCISDNYYVPLNFTAFASSSSNSSSFSVTVKINEVYIGQPVTLAGISALPGPVVNSTTSQSNYGYPTTYPTTTIQSMSSQSFSCTVINSTQFGTCYPTTTSPVYSGQMNESVNYRDNYPSEGEYASTLPGSTEGTFISLWLESNLTNEWSNVNVTFVPQGTAVNSKSGVPEVGFNASDSVDIPTLGVRAEYSRIADLPVSKGLNANLNGTLWARYQISGKAGWQYTELAKIYS